MVADDVRAQISRCLRVPVIAAPMLGISGPELVAAACAAGVVGGFPTANARSGAELDEWLGCIEDAAVDGGAPYAANLIVRSPRFAEDLDVLVRHRAPLVITSVGFPAEAVIALHDVDALVLADVATLRHAERAVAAGADGLVLLSAGAGGQTGWMNPFAYVRAVRSFFDGPLVLAGGIADGHAVHAARVLGCDLAYMGTAFLATTESRAEKAYKEMVIASGSDDIILTRAFTGLNASVLAPSIRQVGLDPAALDEAVTPAQAAVLYGHAGDGPRRWSQVWSAGHSVSGVRSVVSVAELVERISREYTDARAVAH